MSPLIAPEITALVAYTLPLITAFEPILIAPVLTRLPLTLQFVAIILLGHAQMLSVMGFVKPVQMLY